MPALTRKLVLSLWCRVLCKNSGKLEAKNLRYNICDLIVIITEAILKGTLMEMVRTRQKKTWLVVCRMIRKLCVDQKECTESEYVEKAGQWSNQLAQLELENGN